jgi:hypothetical protein
VLSRRLGLALAIATFVLGVLGTQYPFEYRMTWFALHRHWSRIEWSWFPRERSGRLDVEDLVINLIMLIPVGFGWALWRRTVAARRVLAESLLIGLFTGTLYEAGQLLCRQRYTQFADVWRNTVSCVVGAALALGVMALVDRWRRRPGIVET